MELYGQEAEAHLLGAILLRLDVHDAVDVGAERGSFVAAFLAAGSTAVHAIEPDPANAAFLRGEFAGDVRVTVHECAAGRTDGELVLHNSVDPHGAPVPFGHTVLVRPNTSEIGWDGATSVAARSLDTLVRTGELPARVGILKVDTEGHDLSVIAGMGDLEPDVVMVEHWSDLPHSLGVCPWTLEELRGELGPRGFTHFAALVHRPEIVVLQWDDGEVPAGAVANLVFLHDRVLERLAPVLLEQASSLAKAAARVTEMYMDAARERLTAIEELDLALRRQAEQLAPEAAAEPLQ